MKYIVATIVNKTDMAVSLVAHSRPVIQPLYSKDRIYRYKTMAIIENDTEALTLIHEVKFVKYGTSQSELYDLVNRVYESIKATRNDAID